MRPQVLIDRQRLAAFCRQHHIRKLALFGSVLRDDFGPDSDVDVLVEFQTGHAPGFGIVDLEEELAQLLGGRRVDLVSAKYLNPRLRERVLADAEVQYAEG
jgi:predicted nucleotidyltransferase